LEAEEMDPVATRKLWAKAVAIELNRIHHEPTTADPEIGRRIQHQAGDVRGCSQPDRTQSRQNGYWNPWKLTQIRSNDELRRL
jgi:hypothetical protein